MFGGASHFGAPPGKATLLRRLGAMEPLPQPDTRIV